MVGKAEIGPLARSDRGKQSINHARVGSLKWQTMTGEAREFDEVLQSVERAGLLGGDRGVTDKTLQNKSWIGE